MFERHTAGQESRLLAGESLGEHTLPLPLFIVVAEVRKDVDLAPRFTLPLRVQVSLRTDVLDRNSVSRRTLLRPHVAETVRRTRDISFDHSVASDKLNSAILAWFRTFTTIHRFQFHFCNKTRRTGSRGSWSLSVFRPMSPGVRIRLGDHFWVCFSIQCLGWFGSEHKFLGTSSPVGVLPCGLMSHVSPRSPIHVHLFPR